MFWKHSSQRSGWQVDQAGLNENFLLAGMFLCYPSLDLCICQGSILGIEVRPGVCTTVAEPASLPLGMRLPLCICISHLCIASFSNARRKREEHMGIGKACYNLPKSPAVRTASCIHIWKELSCAKMKQNKTKIPLYVVITWH